MASTLALTNTGRTAYQHKLQEDATYGVPQYLGWGTGTTTASRSDTGLQTAAAEARVAGTLSYVTTTSTDDTYKVVGTITSASDQAITEVIISDALTGGNTFMRGTFDALNLSTNDSITFTVTGQIS